MAVDCAAQVNVDMCPEFKKEKVEKKMKQLLHAEKSTYWEFIIGLFMCI